MHCLNLKITYECTNNCRFCFSSYLKDSIMSEENMEIAIRDGYARGCRELVISGGEPTVKPDFIIKLITLADMLGYQKFIIQTNGSGIPQNKKLINFLDKMAKSKEVCLSFSVHGSNEIIHDDMSSTEGAFLKLMSAIESISKTNCKIYTNTVVSLLNLNDLHNIVNLIKPFNPEIMQFSMMHLERPNTICAGLRNSVEAIIDLKDKIELSILKTEGIPYCLLHGMEKCVGESCWPETLDLYNKDNSYMKDFKQLECGMRKKANFCEKCIMNVICMGVWKENFDEFIKLGIKPIIEQQT